MAFIRISVDAARAIQAMRGEPEAIARAIGRWANVGGEYVRGVMVTTIRSSQKPGGKGFLSNSVQVRRGASGFDVVATASYAAPVDEGSRPHIIRPRESGGVLAFQGRTGGTVFAKYVRHPGNQPMNFTGRTADAVAQPLADQLAQEVARELRSLGEA